MSLPHCPFPVADACKLILARDVLGDIDAALRLLGIARSAAPAPIQALSGLLSDHSEQELFEQDLTVDTDIEDGYVAEEAEGRAFQTGARWHSDTRLFPSRQHPYLGSERSMIAYTLTPDRENAAQQSYQRPKVPEYQSVPNRIQCPPRPASTPGRESWRDARRILDSGPKTVQMGQIDLRVCVERIARIEALTVFPRRVELKEITRVEVLVDLTLSTGAYAFDIHKIERALRSAVPTSNVRFRKVLFSDGNWLGGSGPIWSFRLLTPEKTPSWYVVIGGGSTLTLSSAAPLKELTSSLGTDHWTTVVWFGDTEKPNIGLRERSWICVDR
jgi:hypothetical protein